MKPISILAGLSIALTVAFLSGESHADPDPHAEAKLIVGEVNIERAMVFTANRASYQTTVPKHIVSKASRV
jgi:hypothetical protein